MSIKSCYRCGIEFDATPRALICSKCKKPRSPKELSFREQQIIACIREAMSNKAIAFNLHLSEGTVKEYTNKIFNKLGIYGRTAIAIWAVEHGVEPFSKSDKSATESK